MNIKTANYLLQNLSEYANRIRKRTGDYDCNLWKIREENKDDPVYDELKLIDAKKKHVNFIGYLAPLKREVHNQFFSRLLSIVMSVLLDRFSVREVNVRGLNVIISFKDKSSLKKSEEFFQSVSPCITLNSYPDVRKLVLEIGNDEYTIVNSNRTQIEYFKKDIPKKEEELWNPDDYNPYGDANEKK